jgi:hypothetical protein
MSDKNVYSEPFDATTLPLDGEYEGEGEYSGVALRHGVSNDLRELWLRAGQQISAMHGDVTALRTRLLENNLISSRTTIPGNNEAESAGGYHGGGSRGRRSSRGGGRGSRGGGGGGGAPRRPRPLIAGGGSNNMGYGSNAHLRGTGLERILQETAESVYQQDVAAAAKRYTR